MAPLICCGFRSPPSPDQSPIRLVNTSEITGRRFTISTNHSADPPNDNAEAANPPLEDPGPAVVPSPSSSPDSHSRQQHGWRPRHKKSLGRVYTAAMQVRKRISRDSGFPKGSHGLSATELERRRAWKHDIADGWSDDCDEDAVPMEMPKGTWPHHYQHEGSIALSPRQLRRLVVRSSSPLFSTVRTTELKTIAQPSPTRASARTLSRMLTDRASRLTDDSVGQKIIDIGLVPAETSDIVKARARKKYVFSDETPDKTGAPPSPLDRSDTVLWNPSEHHNNHHIPTQGITLEAPPTPNLTALRLASIGDVAGPNWMLSSEAIGTYAVGPKNPDMDEPAVDAHQAQATTNQRPAWLRGASGVLAPSARLLQRSDYEEDCNPAREEDDFGGIDGRDSASHRSSESGGSNKNSVHLYNMRISQRLASQGVAPAVSSPQLRSESSSELSWGRGPEFLSLGSRRRASSSDFASGKIPTSWSNHQRRKASSVYTIDSRLPSQGHSGQAPSTNQRYPPNSYYRAQTVDAATQVSRQPSIERDRRGNLNWSSQPPIPPHAGLSPQVADLSRYVSNPNSRTTSSAMLSRNLSHSTREITDVEGDRIQRNAQNISSNRYFTPLDLEELTKEIAERTTPSTRNASGFDGNGDTGISRSRTIGATSPPRKPSMFVGDEPVGSSVWEKALREHSAEDEKLKRRRPGSTLTPFSGSLKSNLSGYQPSKSSHLRVSSSTEADDVRAQLVSYKLSSRPSNKAMERPTGLLKKRSYSTGSTSSWSRYPSHTRPSRVNSPANEQDSVKTRDFAVVTSLRRKPAGLTISLPTSPSATKKGLKPNLRKHHSLHFDRLRTSLKQIYRIKSAELASKLAYESRGHRSSISAGGIAERPELEMVSPMMNNESSSGTGFPFEIPFPAPPKPSPAKSSPNENGSAVVSHSSPRSSPAKDWTTLYASCVNLPNFDLTTPNASRSSHMGSPSQRVSQSQASNGSRHSYFARAATEYFGPLDMEADADGDESGDVSRNIRASTLDFGRDLEEGERRERERVVGLGMERGG